MFLLKQSWNTIDVVSIYVHIYQFISTDFFGNLMGFLNVVTVVILFIIGLNLYRKQALLATSIQLDQLEKRNLRNEVKTFLFRYFNEQFTPVLKKSTKILYDHTKGKSSTTAIKLIVEAFDNCLQQYLIAKWKIDAPKYTDEINKCDNDIFNNIRDLERMGRYCINSSNQESKKDIYEGMLNIVWDTRDKINELKTEIPDI